QRAHLLQHRRTHSPRSPRSPQRPRGAPSFLDHQPPNKSYGCDECGKAFAWASHLERHRRVHTG
ncbi:CKR1 protein, partial [Zapornia atra]|nr:CKR1 protein [Zapornia atra]